MSVNGHAAHPRRHHVDSRSSKRKRVEEPDPVLESDHLDVDDDGSWTTGDGPDIYDKQDATAGSGVSRPKMRSLMLHQVTCSGTTNSAADHSAHPKTVYYIDPPRLFAQDNRSSFLRGHYPFAYHDEYLAEHEDIGFVVIREYSCTKYHALYEHAFQSRTLPGVEPSTYVQFQSWYHVLLEEQAAAIWDFEFAALSSTLEEALTHVTSMGLEDVPSWAKQRNTNGPYDFFYHHKAKLRAASGALAPRNKEVLLMFLDYIDQNYGQEFAAADAIFASGYVTAATFSKFLTVLEPVVAKHDNGDLQAYVIDQLDDRTGNSLTLYCSCWKFDGGFTKAKRTVRVELPRKRGAKVPIKDMKVWPLRLESDETKEYLRKRGEEVWKCRRKRLVSYEASQNASFDLQINNPRFMIDFDMYHYLHRTERNNEAPSVDGSDDEGEESEGKLHIDMDSDSAPGGHFVSLLPPTIRGFGFHDKRWRDLKVDNIIEVPWNHDAFGQLVLKSSKKMLIEALITFHLEKNDPSDIISNKGNGLILLLHGPPGTGKTLTAETVAERAEMPLYRVTCGDMGTNAESVEKYLESALYVGTIWNCVVLLDEADVFLEERRENDLTRNALVSVFLRVLEYYQGILILTSNRVGHFDEAFKSRVQLAVKYPSLDRDGREQIWMNLLEALKAHGADINFDEIKRKVPSLSRHNLNGRQIRNMIKTARQLALFQTQRMESKHLDEVIDVANEFEDYLKETRGHTYDEWAHEQGHRAP